MTARRADIQWLRAIAALEVVLWHTDLAVKHFTSHQLVQHPLYALLGGNGVEIFFILSGYSIRMQVETVRRPLTFLYTRVARVVPLYWIFTSLVVLAYAVNPAWKLGGGIDTGLGYVVRSYLILPQPGFPILPVGWTLELEAIFYVLVALAMAAGVLQRRPLLFGWGLGAMGAAGILLGGGFKGPSWPLEALNPFMVAFGFGWLLRETERFPPAVRLGWLGLYGLLAASLHGVARPDVGEALIRMALAAAVVGSVLAAGRWLEAHPRVARPVSAIGDASYSIYLSHWFVLAVLGKALAGWPDSASLELAVRALGIAAALAVGLACHAWLETPLGQALRPRSRGRSVTALPMAGETAR